MIKWLSKYRTEGLLTIATYSIACLFFTAVSDDYNNFVFFGLPAMQFSDYPYMDHHYLGFIGLSTVYEWLYKLAPAINWCGITFQLMAAGTLFSLLVTLRQRVLGSLTPPYIRWLVQSALALLFLENFFCISHTRFSLPMCGIALFNLAFSPSLSRKAFSGNMALFTLGLLVRPESGMGMLLLIAGASLLYRFKPLQLAKALFLPALITASLFGAFYIDWRNTSDFVKLVEPEIEYKMMARKVVDIGTMKTAQDSAKYMAALKGQWFDYKVITPEYMRSLQLPTLNLNPAQVTDQKLSRPHSWHPGIDFGIQHVIDVALHVITFYRDYAITPVLIVTLFFLSLSAGNGTKTALRILAIALFTFLLIYLIDYNAFMIAERHFTGIQLVSLLILLFYFFQDQALQPLNQVAKWAAITGLFTGAAFTLLYYHTSNTNKANALHQHIEAMRKIEETYQNRLIVLTNDSFNLFDTELSFFNHNYTKNHYIMFDVFTYSLTPNYLDFLKRQCGCDPANAVALFNWLANQKALYISRAQRFDMTWNYMRTVYNYPLEFLPQPAITKKLAPITGSEFELREVNINP